MRRCHLQALEAQANRDELRASVAKSMGVSVEEMDKSLGQLHKRTDDPAAAAAVAGADAGTGKQPAEGAAVAATLPPQAEGAAVNIEDDAESITLPAVPETEEARKTLSLSVKESATAVYKDKKFQCAVKLYSNYGILLVWLPTCFAGLYHPTRAVHAWMSHAIRPTACPRRSGADWACLSPPPVVCLMLCDCAVTVTVTVTVAVTVTDWACWAPPDVSAIPASRYGFAHSLDPTNMVFKLNLAAVSLAVHDYEGCVTVAEQAGAIGAENDAVFFTWA